MKDVNVIRIKEEEVEAMLGRLQACNIPQADFEYIQAMASTIIFLSNALHESGLKLKSILKRIFGIKSEKTKKVLTNKKKKGETGSPDDSGINPDPPNPPDTSSGGDDSSPSSGTDDECSPADPDRTQGSKECEEGSDKKPKGHGRNGADDFTGANRIFIPHQTLKAGDSCPECGNGKLYLLKPGVFLYIEGKSPVQATHYQLMKLRCNPCGAVFTADLPPLPSVSPDTDKSRHFDESAKSIIALLRYGSGFPMYRLSILQANLGIPLPASTQWEKIEEAADKIYPVFETLKHRAAQGHLIFHDDTIVKILEDMKQIEKEKEEGGDKKIRTGIFTTGVVSVVEENRHIALFFSGRKHAGENMEELLQRRKADLPPPITMSDAKSGTAPKSTRVIEANCNAHGRRKFVYEAENYPDETAFVLKIFGKIYKNDAIAREKEMIPEERLTFHREKSGPYMAELFAWLNWQIDKKLVEPNSDMGKAIKYLLNHWLKLTLFLQIAGAPLDNNICERALKRIILHRKNSLFFKTSHGAYIGDMFMSLIHTCRLDGENPFDYLTELQRHSSEVFRNPGEWLPWNYKEALKNHMKT